MHHDEGDEFMQQKIAGNVGGKVTHLFYILLFANDELQHHNNQKCLSILENLAML